LEALALASSEGLSFHLRIIGEGPARAGIEFQIHQLRLARSVELLGVVPHHRIASHRSWADLLVHAAIEEGFCNAVVESQAAGLAVLTTDAGGLPENVLDGETGVVVPRRDPAAMAKALMSLAEDRDRLVALGEAGLHRAVSEFDPDRQIERWTSFYSRVTGQPT
jgi:colanic acid/amylovoran biosynthesis glycosyltransferase